MCVLSRVDSGADYGLYPRDRIFQRYHLMHPAVPMHRLSRRFGGSSTRGDWHRCAEQESFTACAAAPSDKESP